MLLDALYADRQIHDFLDRHRIPFRRRAGSLAHASQTVTTRRRPRRRALRHLGLSATQISLITGHSASTFSTYSAGTARPAECQPIALVRRTLM